MPAFAQLTESVWPDDEATDEGDDDRNNHGKPKEIEAGSENAFHAVAKHVTPVKCWIVTTGKHFHGGHAEYDKAPEDEIMSPARGFSHNGFLAEEIRENRFYAPAGIFDGVIRRFPQPDKSIYSKHAPGVLVL